MSLALRALRALLVVGLSTLTACHGAEDEAREDFSESLSCPKASVALRTRTDLDAYSISFDGNTPTPSKEVAADPQRLAGWQAEHQKSKDYWASQKPVLYELKGCGHETLYLCYTTTNRNGSNSSPGWGCGEEFYPPGATLWDPAASANLRPVQPPAPPPAPASLKQLTMATLVTAPLNDRRLVGPVPLVDAPPIHGDWATFDPVANLEWASNIATTWSADAKLSGLTWIPNEEGTMDGTSNLTKPTDAVYFEYTSASRGNIDLQLALRTSHVDVLMQPHPGATPPNAFPAPSCPLSRVFTTLLSKTGGTKGSADSTFNVRLEVAGKAADWHVAHNHVSPSGLVKVIDDSFDATTCAVEHPKK